MIERRVYIMKAGNFRGLAFGKENKYSSERWAKIETSQGGSKSFSEMGDEIVVRLADGESVTYKKGWKSRTDITKVFTADFKAQGDSNRLFRF